MAAKPIIVARDFSPRLANRDASQGDGKFTAIEFRNRFLKDLDHPAPWVSPAGGFVVLDFQGVDKIGPSFANEAFAYFTKYSDPDTIRRVIRIINATTVQTLIINHELKSGYTGQ